MNSWWRRWLGGVGGPPNEFIGDTFISWWRYSDYRLNAPSLRGATTQIQKRWGYSDYPLKALSLRGASWHIDERCRYLHYRLKAPSQRGAATMATSSSKQRQCHALNDNAMHMGTRMRRGDHCHFSSGPSLGTPLVSIGVPVNSYALHRTPPMRISGE